MAKVQLRNAWFAPGGRYYFATEGNSFVEIPDELVEFLPATAVVLDLPVASASCELVQAPHEHPGGYPVFAVPPAPKTEVSETPRPQVRRRVAAAA